MDDISASGGGDRLDVDYMKRTLAILEDALGQSDLRPLLQQILDRRRRH